MSRRFTKIDPRKNLKLKAAIVAKYDQLFNFALAHNVHPTKVSHVIARRWNLSPKEQKEWALALGYEPEELFSEEVH